MSQRETEVKSDLQQWKGVNQRTQPTLVPHGFFTFSKGLYFGLGDNAERITGKKLSGKLPNAVFGIYTFENVAYIQSFSSLAMVPISEITGFDITFAPQTPAAPTFGTITSTSIVVDLPAFTLYTLSFSLQRSLDSFTWTTIATNLASLQVYNDSGLSNSTIYYYRVLAVNTSASTPGFIASATTLTPPPTNNRITENSNTRITEDGNIRVTQ